jgi:hypothetical protein
MGMGQGEGEGKPSKEPGRGIARGREGSSGGIVDNAPAKDPREGERIFIKKAPKDGQYDRNRAAPAALGRDDRGPLNENYLQGLPMEYRGLLKNYYESLAK